MNPRDGAGRGDRSGRPPERFFTVESANEALVFVRMVVKDAVGASEELMNLRAARHGACVESCLPVEQFESLLNQPWIGRQGRRFEDVGNVSAGVANDDLVDLSLPMELCCRPALFRETIRKPDVLICASDSHTTTDWSPMVVGSRVVEVVESKNRNELVGASSARRLASASFTSASEAAARPPGSVSSTALAIEYTPSRVIPSSRSKVVVRCSWASESARSAS